MGGVAALDSELGSLNSLVTLFWETCVVSQKKSRAAWAQGAWRGGGGGGGFMGVSNLCVCTYVCA